MFYLIVSIRYQWRKSNFRKIANRPERKWPAKGGSYIETHLEAIRNDSR